MNCPLCQKEIAAFGEEIYACDDCCISYYYPDHIYFDFNYYYDHIIFFVVKSLKSTDNYISYNMRDKIVKLNFLCKNNNEIIYEDMQIFSTIDAENLIRRTLNLRLFI
jgi:hypothetical protein